MKRLIILILLILSNFAYYYKLSQVWLIMPERNINTFTGLGIFLTIVSLIVVWSTGEYTFNKEE